MYYTIRGVCRQGRIIPAEPVKYDSSEEIDVIITFLHTENNTGKSEILTSEDEILYTMGERAANGRFSDASVCHDRYLYGDRPGE